MFLKIIFRELDSALRVEVELLSTQCPLVKISKFFLNNYFSLMDIADIMDIESESCWIYEKFSLKNFILKYISRILRLRIILLKISLDNFLQSEHFCRIVTLNIHLRKILSKD